MFQVYLKDDSVISQLPELAANKTPRLTNIKPVIGLLIFLLIWRSISSHCGWNIAISTIAAVLSKECFKIIIHSMYQLASSPLYPSDPIYIEK